MATSLVTPDLMAQDGFTIQDLQKIPSIKKHMTHVTLLIRNIMTEPKSNDHRIRI